MNFNEFINNWIPEHAQADNIVAVHLFVIPNTNKIEHIYWVCQNEDDEECKVVVHDSKEDPIPEVADVVEMNNHEPAIIVHMLMDNEEEEDDDGEDL